MKRLAALVLAALVLLAAVFAGAWGLVRQLKDQEGRWLLLASALAVSWVVGLSRRPDGSPRWNPRTFFVVFAGGLVGLALVALQPDTVLEVAGGITAVSLVTLRGRSSRDSP